MSATETDCCIKQQQLQHNDLSILRQPINTSVTGFLEVKKAYDDGTDEIRKLLGSECDIIYECKVCRNIFRSLTNFISHKRAFCRKYFNIIQHSHFRNNGFIDQDVTTIIQAEQDYTSTSLSAPYVTTATNSKDNKKDDLNLNSLFNTNNNNSNISNNNNNNNNGYSNGNNKDLSGIIERLKKKQEINNTIKLTDFYDQVYYKLTQEEILQKNYVMQLDKIKNNQNAVYQSVSYNNNNYENINNNNNIDSTCNNNNTCDNNSLMKYSEDNIKKEVNEIYDLLNKNNTVIGPDGKVITMIKKDNLPIIEMPDSDNLLENYIKCTICDLKFATEKMLKLHIKTKHIPSTYVYPCPSCSQSFLQPAAVIRHLNNDHKKSMKRIRTMRDAIYKKRTRIDEVQIKGPSRELIRLQSTSLIKEKLDNDNNKEWMENMGNYNNTPMCTYCGKKFDRKAVLTTHLNNCQQKINNKNNNKISNKNKIIETLQLDINNKTTTTSTALINDEKVNVNSNNSSNNKTNDIDLDDNSNSYDSISADLVTIPTLSAITTSNSNNNNNNSNSNKEIIQSNFHSKLNDYNDSLEINDSCCGNIGGGVGGSSGLGNNNKSEEKIKLVKNNNSKNLSELTNVNKRKRRKAIKLDTAVPNGVANELNTINDEIYWTMDDKGELSVNNQNEKMKLAIAATTSLSTAQQQKCNSKLICDFCDKKFVTINNLNRHVAMYHSAKKYSCKLCTHSDIKKIDVIEHLSKVHSIMGDKHIVNNFIILLKTSDDAKRIMPTADNGEDDEEEDNNSVVSSNSCDNNTILVPHTKSSSSSSSSGSKPSSSSSLLSGNTVISRITSSNDNEHDNDKAIMKYDENESTSNSSFADNDNMNLIKRRGRPRGSKNSPQIRISQTTTRTSSKLDERLFDEICNNLATTISPTTSIKSAVNASLTKTTTLSGSKSDRLYKSLKLPISTLNSSHIKGEHIGKRPIRNRVKPVNKDFVYDLSNLLKKEAEVYKDQQAAVIAAFKQQKRRSIIQQQMQQQQQQQQHHQQQQNLTTHHISSDENSCNDDVIDVFADNKYNLKCVNGAAFEMAYTEVRLNNACFKKTSNKKINEFVENGLNENGGSGGGGGGDTEKMKIAAKIREMRHSDNYRRDAWPILKREQIQLGSNSTSNSSNNYSSNNINNISSGNNNYNNNNSNNEEKTDNNNKIKNLNSRRVSDDYLLKITKRRRLNNNKSPSPPILVPDNNNKNLFIKSSIKSKLKIMMNNNGEDNVSSAISSSLSMDNTKQQQLQQQQKINLLKQQQQQQQQQQQRNKEIREEDKIIVKCPTEKEFKQYLAVNRLTDPIKKIIIPVQTTTTHQQSVSTIVNASTVTSLNSNNNCGEGASSSTVVLPLPVLSTSSENNNVGRSGSSNNCGNQNGKRITLMQRLAENKKRNKQESLLKKN